MANFYLTFLILGGSVVVLQLVLGIAGADGHGILDGADGHHDGEVHGADGLDLFTVRALSAAAALFGVTGLGLMQLGLAGWLALPFAIVAGATTATAVAATMRAMRRLEQDRSFHIESAIGLPATVALSIPPARSGVGKVHLIAHERFQEFAAVTAEDEIPTGTAVLVVDVQSPDTLVVSRSTSLLEDPR